MLASRCNNHPDRDGRYTIYSADGYRQATLCHECAEQRAEYKVIAADLTRKKGGKGGCP
jgi:hypothetical protein